MDIRRVKASAKEIRRSYFAMQLLNSSSIRSRAMMKIVFAEHLGAIMARLMQAFLPSTDANLYHVCNVLASIVKRFPNAATQALLSVAESDPRAFCCFLKCACLFSAPVGSCLVGLLVFCKPEIHEAVFVDNGLVSHVIHKYALGQESTKDAVTGAYELFSSVLAKAQTLPERLPMLRAFLEEDTGVLRFARAVGGALVDEAC
jgi:hypothetical protein